MMTDLYSALNRVQHACSALQNDWLDGDKVRPGGDVSLVRALRELHRVLETMPYTENVHPWDPNRLLRAVLFNGVSCMENAK